MVDEWRYESTGWDDVELLQRRAKKRPVLMGTGLLS